MSIKFKGQIVSGGGGGAVSSVNGQTGAVNIYADDTTLNIDGTALTLTGTGATSTLNVDVGTTANKIVQLDGTAKLPAVDGSALTNLPAAPVTSVNTATGAVVLDTDDIAEGANEYFTTARVDTQVATLPMSTLSDVAYTPGAGIDNYVLTYDHASTSWGAEAAGGGGAVSSVNGQTGAVNIYADDTTLNIDGTALVLSGTGATSTLNVDVGTTANKIVQLDGTAKLPAVDGSQLTGLTSAPVTSVNGRIGVVVVDVIDDTTPQLGGSLDVNGQSIVSVSNGDIDIAPNGTGIIKTTGSIEPDADLTRTIGTESLRYLTTYTDIDGAMRFKAKNDSGGLMTKGQVVYIKGISGSVPTVDLARSNSASTMPAFGLVYANANDQAEVSIVTCGNLNDVDTTTWSLSVGDTVYVSSATAGALTNSAPTGESNLIQNIGWVVRADATAGIIKVGGAGRTAATPNLDNDKIFLGNGSGQAVSTLLSAVNLTSLNQDLTTSTVTEGTNEYFTTARVDTQVATLPMSTLSDVAYTPGAGIDNYVLTYDHSSTSWGAEAAAGGGASRPTVTAITATPYTIGTTDSAIGASELERTYVCSSSAATVNLPTAVGLNGFKLQIKSLLATTVTIDPDGTEHIDHAGQTTFGIATQYTSITLQSDNANWIIV
jgi:hypothetical protein